MVHSGYVSLRARGGALHPDAIEWVLHARVRLPKAEFVDCVSKIKKRITKWSNVVYMHVSLLVRTTRGKVEIPSNLVDLKEGSIQLQLI